MPRHRGEQLDLWSDVTDLRSDSRAYAAAIGAAVAATAREPAKSAVVIPFLGAKKAVRQQEEEAVLQMIARRVSRF